MIPNRDFEEFAGLLSSNRRLQAIARKFRLEPSELINELFLKYAMLPEGFSATPDQQDLIAAVARNKSIDLLRKSNRFSSRHLSIEVVEYEACHEPNAEKRPERKVEEHEEQEICRRAIARLPQISRRIVEAHYLRGIALKEFAQTNGLTYHAVKNQLRRAKVLLQADPAFTSYYS